MSDDNTQDGAEPSPASAGSIAKDHHCQCKRCGEFIAEDRAWMIERIRRRDWLCDERRKQVQKAKERATFWHGKFAIVCAENNALRKRIRELIGK
jgi:hypothetical protein